MYLAAGGVFFSCFFVLSLFRVFVMEFKSKGMLCLWN